MQTGLIKFLNDENGAVTVDWVVLTAAIVGLSVAAYTTINGGTTSMRANTETALSNMEVGNPQIPN